MNENNDIIFTLVLDEGCLQCRHDNIPIYIPPSRTTITFGHFVVVSSSHGRCVMLFKVSAAVNRNICKANTFRENMDGVLVT